MIQQGIDDTSS